MKPFWRGILVLITALAALAVHAQPAPYAPPKSLITLELDNGWKMRMIKIDGDLVSVAMGREVQDGSHIRDFDRGMMITREATENGLFEVRYDRAAYHALWPLEVGRAVEFPATFLRDGKEYSKSRVRIAVEKHRPGAIIDSYVIRVKNVFSGDPKVRETESLYWYLPGAGFHFGRKSEVTAHDGSVSAFEYKIDNAFELIE